MMKYYIAVKAVKAKPMTFGEYGIHVDGYVHTGKVSIPDRPGYLVEYSDGYKSWSPAKAFESSHLEIDDPTKITEADIDRFIGNSEETVSVGKLDEKTTLVKLIPRTGFVQYGVSNCVDPKNYDELLGAEICMKRLRSRLWSMLGFVLQWANNGLQPITKKELK